MNEINKLQKLIDESNNIVFFGGAGVSTESGLKDFRGKHGLYKENNSNKYNPEYMLSISCLLMNPFDFFEYYKNNMNFYNVLPNIVHLYLKKLEDRGKLKAIITQNIDGLHEKANSNNVVLLHGTTMKSYCMKCGKEYDGKYVFNSSNIPECDCGGIVRPDIVLYGEMLGEEFNIAKKYIDKCDLLIVAGTSLTVYPAANLIRNYKGNKLVILNEEQTPFDSFASLVIHESLGKVFTKLK